MQGLFNPALLILHSERCDHENYKHPHYSHETNYIFGRLGQHYTGDEGYPS